MIFEVIFDVETQKLFSDITTDDPADLGVSVVSVYRRTLDDVGNEISGEMNTYWESSMGKSPMIADMWETFERADRIIGFNSKHFDVAALRPYYDKDFSKLPHFDILELVKQSIGRRIGLNALADATIGAGKIDVGTNAVYYWANQTEENLALLKKYCESDVALTRDLYDFGRKHSHLKYLDNRSNILTNITVDFSHPPKKQEVQIGLF